MDLETDCLTEESCCMVDLVGQEYWDEKSDVSIRSVSTIDPISTVDGINSWLDSGNRDVRAIVIHHTYSPNSSQYKGRSTILGIKNYHMSHEFQDIAANFYTTPTESDELIGFTARPLSTKNSAHAYISKNWDDVPGDLRTLANGNRQFLNYYSIGVETIANMDQEDPETSKSMRNSIILMAAICNFYDLGVDKIWPHRAVEFKSCPGTKVSMDWIKQEVEKEMANDNGNCADLPADAYALEALAWGKANGLMVGDSEGNLMSQCPMKRQDFMVILKRYFDKFGCGQS